MAYWIILSIVSSSEKTGFWKFEFFIEQFVDVSIFINFFDAVG